MAGPGIVSALQFVQKAEQNMKGAELGGRGGCVCILMLNKAC